MRFSIKRTSLLIFLCLLTAPALGSDQSVSFRKVVLTSHYFCDGISFGDINRDGHPDIVAGPFWYEGPDFKKNHAYYEPVQLVPEESPSNSMYSFLDDFNGDGWLDILRLGRVHMHEAVWFENPGISPGLWKSHFIIERVKGESPAFADLDGDGARELVSHWDDHWGMIRPDRSNPTAEWVRVPVTEEGKWKQFYHGTGVADFNLDSLPDLILNEGIWLNPGPDGKAPWQKISYRFAEKGGAQMTAYDVDGDGDQDVVTALDGHTWGIAWFEQTQTASGITFEEHKIMGNRQEEKQYGVAFSQPHALEFSDIDGDGLTDIVVGKRLWAHGPEGDVEPNATPVVYWFQLLRTGDGKVHFEPHLIDDASGVGTQISCGDLNGDGQTDILTSSKLGAFLFLQEPKN